jgi:hypothetical protein
VLGVALAEVNVTPRSAARCLAMAGIAGLSSMPVMLASAG